MTTEAFNNMVSRKEMAALKHRISELEKSVKELAKLVEIAGETGRRKTFKVPRWVKKL